MHELQSLAIIWTAVLAAHFLAAKTRLTPVLWFLAAGCLLANTGVIPSQPGEFIRGMSEVGIIVIMFALGFEENSSVFVASLKRSWGIALFGALAPFAIAYSFAWQIWGDEKIALMCGLAMTATAVSLTMVSLRSEGLAGTPAATGIMTSAVLDDIASLIAVAIMVPVATGQGQLDMAGISILVAKAIAFFVFIAALGMWVFPIGTTNSKRFPNWLPSLHGLLVANRGQNAVLVVLLLALAVALLGHVLGFHPAVGAYMAGLILKEDYFHQATETPDEVAHPDAYSEVHRIVDNVAFSWIGPIFFVSLGAQILLDVALLASVLLPALLLFVALFFGQVASAGLAAFFTGGFSKSDSILIGLGMLGRAELAFVVLDIAYVQNSILNREAFYTLMVTAFLLNIAVPLSIQQWKRMNVVGNPQDRKSVV